MPGDAARSALIRLVASVEEEDRMPSKGSPLSPREIATLTAWINEGAIWPDGVDATTLIAKTEWWSLKPPHLAGMAALKPGRAIDDLVAARRSAKGLVASPRADRRTLIRRLFLVVHGFLTAIVFGYIVDTGGNYELPMVPIFMISFLSALAFFKIDSTRPLLEAPARVPSPPDAIP